jgi:hypothetical protein
MAGVVTTPPAQLVNAQEMGRKYPATFWAPDRRLLDTIRPGSLVVVATEGERFWAIVAEREGDRLVGIVDNHLIYTDEHGLRYGDRIEFFTRNVYDVDEIRAAKRAD